MAAASSRIETAKVRERLLYIDDLRIIVVAFVVMHHLAVPTAATAAGITSRRLN